ncbi:outer membrane beta-barrel protein [Candidatus Colwellia aromaticivorans]|uniref:outer membrane beta-barrel protein n=1 Tax=Candidatus Colwellia aromaticivorans TaxID=2267621 RepID=UPI000DF39EE7|nr:outer membrane beta-barrel protein [Candidatus Colwellia aromaticivorans]
MFKKTALAILIAGTSFSSLANWVGGVSYINLSDDEDGIDISLSGISGSLGYKIDSNTNFNFIPEVRIGTGISDDTVYGVDVEMDSFIALSVRGQYSLENGVYLFAAPSYANVELTASYGGYSETDDSWEFGIGGGAGYKFNESTSAEFMYEQYDGTDVLSFGVKFDF